MNNNLTNLESLKSQIRPFLKDFLEDNNIKISKNGMLTCINPSHNDNNASMKVLHDLNDEYVYCYGCNASADIFTANYWLTKAPLLGVEFIKDNVYTLANEFKIPYNEIHYSEEDIRKHEEYRFNKIVSNLLIAKDKDGNPNNITYEHAIKRGWLQPICQELKIGTIINLDKFINEIQIATGYTISDINKKGITNRLFGPDRLTISLFDDKGNVIGFTARNLKWVKGSEDQKYINSSHSDIFKKGEILYGMHLSKKFKSRRLDIFEGNGSFITAHQAGHNCCVAICGNSITEEHIDLIRKIGFTHVNLVLDTDKTGLEKMNHYMKQLAGIEGLKVSYTKLLFKSEHKDLKDPEDFIKTYGLGEFFKLKPVTAFDFFVQEEAKLHGHENEFVNKMIKIILNTENRIERGKQIKTLSNIVDIDDKDIRAEIDRLSAQSTDMLKKDISKRISAARDTNELINIIDTVRDNIDESSTSKQDRQILSVEESIENFQNLLTILENKKPGLQGWKTGYEILDVKLSGIPKPIGLDDKGNPIAIPGSIIGLAGAPQHCKSTIIQNIALRIAELNTDVTVLYWALDDSRERTYERMLAIHSGVSWNSITRRVPLDPKDKPKIIESSNKFTELVRSGRLILKDHSIGSTIPLVKRWVEMAQEQFGRPVLLVIDSFHKISGDTGATSFESTKAKCQDIKSFVQTHNITVLASLELNKGSSRGIEPDMLHITETRKIEYDFDIVGIVYNHYFDTDGDTPLIITAPTENGTALIKPLIKLNIRKSKEGGAGPIYYALNPSNFSLKEYSVEEVRKLTNTEPVAPKNFGGLTLVPPDIGGLMKQHPFHNQKTY